MLNLSRRHSATKCGKTKKRDCTCPIWVTGSLQGRKMRKSLGIRNWESAQKIVRDMEARVHGDSVSVKDAFERFITARAGKGLRSESLGKYRLLERELVREFGSRPVDAVRVDDLARYREGWKLAAISARKKIERLRSFFKFCLSRGWVERNPASELDMPALKFSPTLPVTDTDLENLLAACDRFPNKGIYGERTGARIKTFLLVLRYAGLRIRDCVMLKRDSLSDGRIFIYAQKTGVPVYVPIPDFVVAELQKWGGEYFFWSGAGLAKSAVADWQRSLSRLGKFAGISFHPHQLRNSFALSLLKNGVGLETVAILLGNSVKIAERHYSAFVPARQAVLEEAVKRTFA